jgi:hypothetical protein
MTGETAPLIFTALGNSLFTSIRVVQCQAFRSSS